jgi:hypothetical protein
MARVLAALAVVTLASLGCSSAAEDPPAPEATSTAEQALTPPLCPKPLICTEEPVIENGKLVCKHCGRIPGL